MTSVTRKIMGADKDVCYLANNELVGVLISGALYIPHGGDLHCRAKAKVLDAVLKKAKQRDGISSAISAKGTIKIEDNVVSISFETDAKEVSSFTELTKVNGVGCEHRKSNIANPKACRVRYPKAKIIPMANVLDVRKKDTATDSVMYDKMPATVEDDWTGQLQDRPVIEVDIAHKFTDIYDSRPIFGSISGENDTDDKEVVNAQ
jgi:hypothetical protein